MCDNVCDNVSLSHIILQSLPNWGADSADLWIMLKDPSIGAWGAISGPKTKSLPSSADTWLSQLIVDAFPSGIRIGKAAGSFKEGNLLEESLPVVILDHSLWQTIYYK